MEVKGVRKTWLDRKLLAPNVLDQQLPTTLPSSLS